MCVVFFFFPFLWRNAIKMFVEINLNLQAGLSNMDMYQCFVVALQSLRRVQPLVTPWLEHTRIPCPSPSGLKSSPLRQWNHPTVSSSVIPFSSCLLSFPVSESFPMLIRWLKFCNFSFSIKLYNGYSGLISFRIDWFDLIEVKGTLKSLLQHHSSKASIFCPSSFFMVQL